MSDSALKKEVTIGIDFNGIHEVTCLVNYEYDTDHWGGYIQVLEYTILNSEELEVDPDLVQYLSSSKGDRMIIWLLAQGLEK